MADAKPSSSGLKTKSTPAEKAATLAKITPIAAGEGERKVVDGREVIETKFGDTIRHTYVDEA